MRKNAAITGDCSACKKAVCPIGPRKPLGISSGLLQGLLPESPLYFMAFFYTVILCQGGHNFTAARTFNSKPTLDATFLNWGVALLFTFLNFRNTLTTFALACQGRVPRILRVSVWGGRPPLTRIYHL